ncbi:uncharacterized protein Z519_03884 [Cladophialophora bantiana CBS 173.52]|uniref:Heterokaryon incompatibility domain-containing protein n=1 Tax=Cladophialophora bantiana (strain ATCC 10958 / CBS 173.52 / CDC B-1940 / NIH 8579) TaxID=1442370 RepID=A0A0D2HWJ2_CLAB1|nr:uncharacterized protein Z519_03884 [Cladophialophora bantiana CBS 173.52]KIW95300.1 hypothetical protein Z519_03884 [Cladophialophora bantiana CBS 173.52]
MDHIPTPEHPFRPIHVPWLGGSQKLKVNYEYDSKGFLDFPSRHGWSTQSLQDANFEGKNAAQTAAFLQEWLYFGLISSVFQICGISFNRHDFIRRTSGLKYRAFVTTRTLGKKLQQWYDKEKYGPSSTKSEHEQDIRYNFTFASGVLEAFNRKLRSAGDNVEEATYLRNCLPGEAELSVVVLLATIQYFHMVIYDPPSRLVVPTCPWLSSLMVSEGWCAGQVTKLWRRHNNVLTMYYFKMLGPPTVKKDHSRCSARRCAANDVLEDIYVTAHFPKMITKRMNCRCGGHMGPPSDKLVAIIKDGKIPIISVRCPTTTQNGKWDDSLDLRVIAYTGDTPYVAISHVWSDGLGNPRANTLPICQLKALRTQLQYMILTNPEYFDDIFPEGLHIHKTARLERLHFWIDTLCVPVNNLEMRKKAILDMRNVYEAASAVLVKDAELNAQSRYCPLEEVMARVCVSPWCGRLWTLQEGTLNDRVFVQMSHKEVVMLDDLNEPTRSLVLLSDELLDAESADLIEPISGSLNGDHNGGPGHMDFAAKFAACPSAILSMNVLPGSIGSNPISRQTKAELFLQILTEVQCRETSKASDEAICITTLLDAGVEDVLRESTRDRRWTVFLSVVEDIISARIIFASLPRMTLEGYNWAPRTFLSCAAGPELVRVVNVHGFDPGNQELQQDSDIEEPNHARQVSRPVRIGERGLMVAFMGLTFQPLANPLSPEFCFTEDDGNVTYWCVTEYSPVHFEAYFEGTAFLREESWDMAKPGAPSRLSVVLENHFSDPTAPVRGALLTNCREEANVVYGRYLCLVLVMRTTKSYQPPAFELAKEKMVQNTDHAQWELAVDAKFGGQQEWCIA